MAVNKMNKKGEKIKINMHRNTYQFIKIMLTVAASSNTQSRASTMEIHTKITA